MKIRNISKIPAYSVNLCKTGLARRIPWLYRFFPVRLKSANINITDRCCFKCIMCNQWNGPEKKELSINEWKDAFRQLKKVGVRHINISGGEPLMRPDLADLIRFASGLGFEITVMTNGYLLDEKMLACLIDSGVKSISISLDGVGMDFESVRGISGAFKRVRDACALISRSTQDGSIVGTVSFVLMKDTINHLEDVLKLRRELQLPLTINLADFTPYFFDGKKKEQFWIDDSSSIAKVQKMLVLEKEREPGSIIMLYSEIDYIRRYFNDPLQNKIPCVVSQVRICIDPEGEIYGGCWSMGKFGNIRSMSLESVIGSQRYKDAHRKMFFKKCPGCSCGYSVNLRNYFPTVMQEIVFRAIPSFRKKISG